MSADLEKFKKGSIKEKMEILSKRNLDREVLENAIASDLINIAKMAMNSPSFRKTDPNSYLKMCNIDLLDSLCTFDDTDNIKVYIDRLLLDGKSANFYKKSIAKLSEIKAINCFDDEIYDKLDDVLENYIKCSLESSKYGNLEQVDVASAFWDCITFIISGNHTNKRKSKLIDKLSRIISQILKYNEHLWSISSFCTKLKYCKLSEAFPIIKAILQTPYASHAKNCWFEIKRDLEFKIKD